MPLYGMAASALEIRRSLDVMTAKVGAVFVLKENGIASPKTKLVATLSREEERPSHDCGSNAA
jgi:hypothetical protein